MYRKCTICRLDMAILTVWTVVSAPEMFAQSSEPLRLLKRVAWTVGDNKRTVGEVGSANLTHDETAVLIHVGRDKTQAFGSGYRTEKRLTGGPAAG